MFLLKLGLRSAFFFVTTECVSRKNAFELKNCQSFFVEENFTTLKRRVISIITHDAIHIAQCFSIKRVCGVFAP